MKTVFVPLSKEEMNYYINDVNHEMKGDRQVLSEKDFDTLWKSGILNKFYQDSDIFIDDYEMTIIEDISDLIFLKKILEDISIVHYKLFQLGKKILSLVNLAIERESGMIFFF